MSELTNYIKERISELEDLKSFSCVDRDIVNFGINELQVVLSKIEELGEKESEESRLEALNLKRLMERDYPQELNK